MVKRHRDRRQGILPPSFWFCSPSIIKQMLPKYNSQVDVSRVPICQLGQTRCSKHLLSCVFCIPPRLSTQADFAFHPISAAFSLSKPAARPLNSSSRASTSGLLRMAMWSEMVFTAMSRSPLSSSTVEEKT